MSSNKNMKIIKKLYTKILIEGYNNSIVYSTIIFFADNPDRIHEINDPSFTVMYFDIFACKDSYEFFMRNGVLLVILGAYIYKYTRFM